MKILILSIITIIFSFNTYAQFVQYAVVSSEQELFDSLLVDGIREFHAPIKHQNFSKAIHALEQATELKPNNAIAHYYLGYAYSKQNSLDAKQLPAKSKSLCIKANNEMRNVIALDSAFKPKLALSPYSKITAEWGALALMYLYNNDEDSMKWAFEQGRNNGGFSNFMLAYYRLLLDQCSDSTILISSGDDNYWNLLYLQFEEHYRTDVSVLDLGLLNTLWYQQFLNDHNILHFQMAPVAEINYYLVPYNDTLINVPIHDSNTSFFWNYQARGSNPFYLRYGDVAIRNILISNEFRRKIFFTKGIASSDLYHLENHLENQIIVNRLNPFGKSELEESKFYNLAEKTLELAPLCNLNSTDEWRILDNIRLSIAARIYHDWTSTNGKENAKKLMQLLNRITPSKTYPYSSPENKLQMDQFRRVIMEDY
jgi:hypothetical protein